ncbi:MAG: hypothetical protein HOM55_01055 [Proteobacteria bacterium]|jgi:hypothetical protein|nr:hypothetical protein [Pseudomonadota bacterium]
MTEADILYQLSELYNRYWAMNQWWASISFAIIALSHFASHKLNKILVSIIIVLYAAYSFWMQRYMHYNVLIIGGLFQDLEVLKDSGIVLSNAANQYLAVTNDALTLYFIRIATFGTFVCSNSYLIYSQLNISKKTKAQASS